MPYIECTSCGHRVFSTAYWFSVARCWRCGDVLPRPRRSGDPPRPAPEIRRPGPAGASPDDTAQRGEPA